MFLLYQAMPYFYSHNSMYNWNHDSYIPNISDSWQCDSKYSTIHGANSCTYKGKLAARSVCAMSQLTIIYVNAMSSTALWLMTQIGNCDKSDIVASW